jgi:hypothetical protein
MHETVEFMLFVHLPREEIFICHEPNAAVLSQASTKRGTSMALTRYGCLENGA